MKKKTAKEVYEDGYVEGYMDAVDEVIMDIKDIRKYFKLDGHLIASKIKKWEGKKNG